MATTRLEFTDATSNKFWEVTVEGATHTVRYGRIGAAGSEKTEAFADQTQAQKSADKLIASKMKKGYVAVAVGDSPSSPSSSSTATPPAVASKAKASFDEAAFEKKYGVRAPARYQKFVSDNEAALHKGKYVADLPHYTSDSKFNVEFCKPGFDLFEDNDIDRGDHDDAWMPLATLAEEPQFLAVNLSSEACAVAMWEHEDGMFHPVAASLDAFLASLVAKSAKPKNAGLKAAVTKAQKLQEQGKHQAAIDVLGPALEGLTPGMQKMDGNQDQLPAAYNLLGICYGKVDRIDDAIVAFKAAVESGTVYAALNILDSYGNHYNDPQRVIDYAEQIKGKYLDAYCWFWVRKYVARAYVALGKAPEAELAYRAIFDRLQTTDVAKIDDVIADLRTYVSEAKPHAVLATNILGWFKKKDYSVTTAQAQANRAWWDSLPDFVQPALREAVQVQGSLNDEDLARVFDVRSLDLSNDHALNDVAPLARLIELTRLVFHGKPTTLEPLRSLSKLEKLMINDSIIKNLELPNRSNQPLFDAVKAGDLEAIKRALAAGADVNSKNDEFGSSPLHLAVMNHDVDGERRLAIALLLIEHGGNPYAQDMDDSDVFKYSGSAKGAALKAAFVKRGGVAPGEGPFLISAQARTKGAVSLDSVKGYSDDHLFDKGVPLLAEYPAGAVTSKMRTDYPGHKKDTLLCDYHERHGIPFISGKLKAFLVERGVSHVEYLPLSILDHSDKVVSEDYFIVNPLARDCLDRKQSQPTYNLIDESRIMTVKQLVIDASRVPAEVQVFRIKDYGDPVVFRTELANAIVAAGFSNVVFSPPKQ